MMDKQGLEHAAVPTYPWAGEIAMPRKPDVAFVQRCTKLA